MPSAFGANSLEILKFLNEGDCFARTEFKSEKSKPPNPPTTKAQITQQNP